MQAPEPRRDAPLALVGTTAAVRDELVPHVILLALAECRWRSVDLGRAAMIRATLIILDRESKGTGRYMLVLTVPHIAFDGWSHGVLFRELVSSRSHIVDAIAPNAFGAYVVHVLPVVVGIQFALAGVSLDPFVKFALVTVVSVIVAAVVGGNGWSV